MPVKNRFAEMLPEITAWRHDFHAHPELQFDVQRTAARVAGLLRDFGLDEVTEGVGRTGVVGVIRGRSDSAGRVIALRADMDALPITEATGLPYASKATSQYRGEVDHRLAPRTGSWRPDRIAGRNTEACRSARAGRNRTWSVRR